MVNFASFNGYKYMVAVWENGQYIKMDVDNNMERLKLHYRENYFSFLKAENFSWQQPKYAK